MDSSAVNDEKPQDQHAVSRWLVMLRNLIPGMKKMDTEANPGRTTILPIEWLVQVIYWLPTQYIFTIMCVNREWECACRYVIRTRQRLQIDGTSYHKKDWKPDAYTIVLRNKEKEMMMQMLTSLKPMKSLMSVDVDPILAWKFMDLPCNLMDEIIAQNASTLKEVTCHHLPDDGKIVYPLLIRLTCHEFDASTATRLCPRLTSLTVTGCIAGDEGYPHIESLRCFNSTLMPVPGGKEFMTANAATLESITCHQLPVSMWFPELKQLSQVQLPVDDIFLPALEDFTLTQLGWNLLKRNEFPFSNVTKIDVIMDAFEIESAMHQLSHMINLTHVNLVFSQGSTGDYCKDRVVDPFMNMHHLQEVCIRFDGRYVTRDPSEVPKQYTIWPTMITYIHGFFPLAKTWSSSLFIGNPDLRSVTLHGIPVSDEDLSLCSRLTHLKKLSLGYNLIQGFTIAGIRTLLRGAPRHTITEFTLIGDAKIIRGIDSEIIAIEEDRRVKFVTVKQENKSLREKLKTYSRMPVTASYCLHACGSPSH
jgi:hypothetical protein